MYYFIYVHVHIRIYISSHFIHDCPISGLLMMVMNEPKTAMCLCSQIAQNLQMHPKRASLMLEKRDRHVKTAISICFVCSSYELLFGVYTNSFIRKGTQNPMHHCHPVTARKTTRDAALLFLFSDKAQVFFL
jgi:hypothetical protein